MSYAKENNVKITNVIKDMTVLSSYEKIALTLSLNEKITNKKIASALNMNEKEVIGIIDTATDKVIDELSKTNEKEDALKEIIKEEKEPLEKQEESKKEHKKENKKEEKKKEEKKYVKTSLNEVLLKNKISRSDFIKNLNNLNMNDRRMVRDYFGLGLFSLSIEEMSKRYGIKAEDVNKTINGIVGSMLKKKDEKVKKDDKKEKEQSKLDKFLTVNKITKEQFMSALSGLSLEEKSIVSMYFGIGQKEKSLAEIAVLTKTNPLKVKMDLQDILKNINHFIAEEIAPPPTPQAPKPELLKPWLNYRVNLFVDNSNTQGSPVIMDSNYSYQNIFGKLEYENQYGMLKTDYTMLKSGTIHKANGGYLILQAQDLLTNQPCYDALKKALSIEEISIDNNMDQRSNLVMISLKPEPIPLHLKVILIGDANIYHTLLSLDPDFRKLFKIKVEFEESAPRTDDTMLKLAKFVHSYSEKECCLPLDRGAMAKVVEFASRLSDDKEKLSTHFNEIGEIVSEASTWAKLSRKKIVTVDYVQKALDKRVERVKKYDQKYTELIEENSLLIDTEGYKVGEINGLTVLTIGDYSFGKPTKITANTFMGKAGVINIERETEMSGSSHSKGILILRGYFGEKFAQDFPLSLTASLCFEQLYNGVDGDSASSTECYAILSSLSGMPINQAIAVTGSVNQKGIIQPIGGVNEKIEGFYAICKKRGLTGEQGVIIPIQNVRNLHLSDNVIESVKQGKFHIYAVSTIDEGIEILTGVPAGKQTKSGTYPAGTINYLVYEKLKKYYENSKEVK